MVIDSVVVALSSIVGEAVRITVGERVADLLSSRLIVSDGEVETDADEVREVDGVKVLVPESAADKELDALPDRVVLADRDADGWSETDCVRETEEESGLETVMVFERLCIDDCETVFVGSHEME